MTPMNAIYMHTVLLLLGIGCSCIQIPLYTAEFLSPSVSLVVKLNYSRFKVCTVVQPPLIIIADTDYATVVVYL